MQCFLYITPIVLLELTYFKKKFSNMTINGKPLSFAETENTYKPMNINAITINIFKIILAPPKIVLPTS